jgi:hypothetical protein
MKTCTYCGKEHLDDATVCELDGQPLADRNAPKVTAPRPPDRESLPPEGYLLNQSVNRRMKRFRKLHLYLGCIFTPMLILFAATGATQMFGLRLGFLSEAHMHGSGSLPFMILSFFMGVSVIITSLLGVAMAFRFGESKRVVWACLGFGVLLPIFLLMIAHFKR